jgi:hypothetical protein
MSISKIKEIEITQKLRDIVKQGFFPDIKNAITIVDKLNEVITAVNKLNKLK